LFTYFVYLFVKLNTPTFRARMLGRRCMASGSLVDSTHASHDSMRQDAAMHACSMPAVLHELLQ
jgi:hypothetical protein